MTDFIRKYYHNNVKPKSVREFPVRLAEQYAHMGALEGWLFDKLDNEGNQLFTDYAVTATKPPNLSPRRALLLASAKEPASRHLPSATTISHRKKADAARL